MSNKNIVPELLAESPNRRSLLRNIGMAGAAVAVGGKLKADPAMPTVVDVLQFALNLEYLEAEFYTVATMGMNLPPPAEPSSRPTRRQVLRPSAPRVKCCFWHMA
jgi:hypothetical protein